MKSSRSATSHRALSRSSASRMGKCVIRRRAAKRNLLTEWPVYRNLRAHEQEEPDPANQGRARRDAEALLGTPAALRTQGAAADPKRDSALHCAVIRRR